MPDKYRRKIPDRPEKRRPKQEKRAEQPEREAWQPGDTNWLPSENADYTAWVLAAERAYREFRIARDHYYENRGYQSQYQAFLKATDLLSYTHKRAYPPDFGKSLKDLYDGTADNLEISIAFLEADGYFFGSGYTKATIIRYLKWLPLTPAQQRRLQEVVLRVIDKGWRQEFRSYEHLARHVQSADWLEEVRCRLASDDPQLAVRARRILDACLKK